MYVGVSYTHILHPHTPTQYVAGLLRFEVREDREDAVNDLDILKEAIIDVHRRTAKHCLHICGTEPFLKRIVMFRNLCNYEQMELWELRRKTTVVALGLSQGACFSNNQIVKT